MQECKLHRQFEDFHRHPNFDFAIRRDEENAQKSIAQIENVKLFCIPRYNLSRDYLYLGIDVCTVNLKL